jgi:hypothetical protein
MAQKLSFFGQWMWGNWAERDVINNNAETLETIESKMSDLQSTVARQTQEIARLRAMIAGLVDVLQTKVSFDDAELESAANAAWTQLQPPPTKQSGDPYRGLPQAAEEPTAEEIEAAKQLLRVAQDHHFAKQFETARSVYTEIIDRYGATKEAGVARQQLANLRGM